MATNSGGHSNYDYYHQQPRRISPQYKVAAAIVVILGAIALLAKLLRFWLRSLKEAQEADSGDRTVVVYLRAAAGAAGGSTRRHHQQQPQARSRRRPRRCPLRWRGRWGRRPLVCTYRRADGWREAACAVCLAELADGEAVRVLPACMHYFPAECVGEWLRAHDTCPLCRTPLDPTAARLMS